MNFMAIIGIFGGVIALLVVLYAYKQQLNRGTVQVQPAAMPSVATQPPPPAPPPMAPEVPRGIPVESSERSERGPVIVTGVAVPSAGPTCAELPGRAPPAVMAASAMVEASAASEEPK